MTESVRGMAALNRRIAAIKNVGEPTMRLAGQVTIGQMKRNVPHRTSNTARSLRLTRVTPNSARVEGSGVLVFIDEGTGLYGPHHQKITPKAAKALHWMGGGPAKVRLSGRSRTVRGVAQAIGIFARSVKGMKPRRFIARSIMEASRLIGVELKADVIKRWNDAG